MWWFMPPLLLTSILGLCVGLTTFYLSYELNSKFFEYLTEIFLVPFLMLILIAPVNLMWYILVLIWTPFI